MSTTTRESVFVLLKLIKRHEEKQPEGRTKLTKLKTMNSWTNNSPLKHFTFKAVNATQTFL